MQVFKNDLTKSKPKRSMPLLPDCGPPPIEIVELSPYTFHVTGSSVSTSLGSKAKYSCGGAGTPFAFAKDIYNPRVPFYKSPFKICSSDFTWTNNRYDCLRKNRTVLVLIKLKKIRFRCGSCKLKF